MKRVEILVEESLYEFYRKVGAQAGACRRSGSWRMHC